jgi:hypothetical protein
MYEVPAKVSSCAGRASQRQVTKFPFSRRFCSELVATMPAVHAPKLKPTIAPRHGIAGYGWEASSFSDSAISLRKASTAGTEGDASASLPEYRHTAGASSGDQYASMLPR